MHNVFTRYKGLEPGTFTVKMHRSKPHMDATGADDPDTCKWCLLPTAFARDPEQIRSYYEEAKK